jgi:hypothetical protein
VTIASDLGSIDRLGPSDKETVSNRLVSFAPSALRTAHACGRSQASDDSMLLF